MIALLHLLAQLLGVLAVTMVLPALIAMFEGERANADAFLITAGLTGFFTGAILLALRGRRRRLDRFSAFTFAAVVWIAPPWVAAVPLAMGADLDYSAALFEAASAYTTTGATVFESFDGVGPAILFWRAELQWLGGLVTLMAILMVLAPAGVGGLSNRHISLVGRRVAHGLGRTLAATREIATAYVVMTVVCFGLLVMTPVPDFDALCIALATVSTGGMMPNDGDIGAYGSPGASFVLMIFMLIGATSVVWHRMVFRAHGPLLTAHRESYWVIGVALALGVAYATRFADAMDGSSLAAVGNGLFTAISMVSTTGFEIAPGGLTVLPLVVLAVVAMIGGGALSTAGGIKFFRVGAMFTQSMHELKRLLYPHSVRSTRFGSHPYDIDLMKAIWTGAVASLAVVGLATLLISLDLPDFSSSVLAAVSAFSNIGPLYAAAVENGSASIGYGDFNLLSRLVMIAAMIAGRIEVIALLALLNIAYWRS